MDETTVDLLKLGGAGGTVLGALILVFRLIVNGRLIPLARHNAEIKILEDRIASDALQFGNYISWITADRDGYRAGLDVERSRMDPFAESLRAVADSQKQIVFLMGAAVGAPPAQPADRTSATQPIAPGEVSQ